MEIWVGRPGAQAKEQAAGWAGTCGRIVQQGLGPRACGNHTRQQV